MIHEYELIMEDIYVTYNNYKFKVGSVIYFNSSVGLELALNYFSESSSDSKYNYLIISLGFQIHLIK